MKVCSIARAQKWITKRKATAMGFTRIERAQDERQFVGAVPAGKAPVTAMLSGVAEQYPITKLPSDWFEKEGKEVPKDVEKILDKNAGPFQELYLPREK